MIDNILKVVSSCKTFDQVMTTMDWVERLVGNGNIKCVHDEITITNAILKKINIIKSVALLDNRLERYRAKNPEWELE